MLAAQRLEVGMDEWVSPGRDGKVPCRECRQLAHPVDWEDAEGYDDDNDEYVYTDYYAPICDECFNMGLQPVELRVGRGL